MKTYVRNFTSEQVHLSDFDNSRYFETLSDSLITTTQGPGFTLNPFYKCSCRRGYSISSDPFNPWKLQESIDHYSRGDLKRAYRLGEWY